MFSSLELDYDLWISFRSSYINFFLWYAQSFVILNHDLSNNLIIDINIINIDFNFRNNCPFNQNLFRKYKY